MEKQKIVGQQICEQFSSIVSPLIGGFIGSDDIITDESGYYYYIPKQKLQPKHPLILNHYRGQLFMVIPTLDWKDLENGTVSVQEYVDTSWWNYGYLWGGCNFLGGVQWQPFESGTGIHETENISRYLRILRCRTIRHSSGYMPSETSCLDCTVEHCPFSEVETKKAGASWDNEFQEVDDRIALFKAAKERLEREFGFKATACHNFSDSTMVVFPQFMCSEVDISLPADLMVDMQYNPGKYDVEKVANELKIVVGIPLHRNENDELVLPTHVEIPEGANKEFILDTWKKAGCCKEWFPEEKNCMPDINMTLCMAQEPPEKRSLWQRIRDLF